MSSDIQRIRTSSRADGRARIDTETVRVDNNIIALLEKRVALCRERNALSPAVDLPTEILEIIFEFACCPSDTKLFDTIIYEMFGHTCFSPHKGACALTPVLIGSVCSVWRNITLGASQLWDRIEMVIDKVREDTHVEMLRSWLSRSGQRPLTIRLMISQLAERYTQATAVIDVLSAHAHRLHIFDSFIPQSWGPALLRIANDAHQLVRLTMRETEDNPCFEHVDFFVNLPPLCEVAFVGFYCAEDISFPWSQLVSLHMSGAEECFKTLRLCPLLRTCTVNLRYPSYTPILPTSTLTLASLEVLEVISTSQLNLEQFLQSLMLPALRSFSSGISRMGESSIPSLLSLISRSACNLESLCLAGSTSPNDLAECLQASPGLRKLLIYDPQRGEVEAKFTQRLLDLMNPKRYFDLAAVEYDYSDELPFGTGPGVYQTGSEMFLGPNLETLVFDGEVLFDAHNLVEFIADRWNCPSNNSQEDHLAKGSVSQTDIGRRPWTANLPAARLQSVTFKATGLKMTEVDAAVVQKLRLEGMKVELQER